MTTPRAHHALLICTLGAVGCYRSHERPELVVHRSSGGGTPGRDDTAHRRDVNGDGYDDLVVGAPGTNDAVGAVYLYLGTARGVSTARAATLRGPGHGDSFGSSVAIAGDVNGDGFADVLVDTESVVTTGTDHVNDTSQGKVRVYFGRASELGSAPDLELTAAVGYTDSNVNWGGNPAAPLVPAGYAVMHAGDVNGDGFADVVYNRRGMNGAPLTENRHADVFLGGPDGPELTASTTLDGWAQPVGDTNGDGFDDILLRTGVRDCEHLTLHRGSPTGPELAPDALMLGCPTPDLVVANPADVNGDGFDDIVATDTARVETFLGGPAGPSERPSRSLFEVSGWEPPGWDLITSADVNGDGFSDVLLHGFGTGTFVIAGSRDGLSTETLSGLPNMPDRSGFDTQELLVSIGDLDSDGYADIASVATAGPSWVIVYPGSAGGVAATGTSLRDADPAFDGFGASID